MVPKGKTKMGEVICSTAESARYSRRNNSVQSNVKSGNVEVEWNNIKKCVIDNTMRDLIVEVERRGRKLWITLEMISKTDERRKRKNVNKEERKNYRRSVNFCQSRRRHIQE
jgi:hypothetical protein